MRFLNIHIQCERKYLCFLKYLKYAKSNSERGNQFIIIPQNGLDLAFNNMDDSKGLNLNFMQAIDGFGVEELFYDGKKKEDKYRIRKYISKFIHNLNNFLIKKKKMQNYAGQ